ncbi:unnamed protein product [Ectocarpus sp. CCAP 1310/34]|nr:unnamed protein product [Ectocarpus sp. CCAP 1310/34]
MWSASIGPVTVTIGTICIAAVAIMFFCCLCCLLSPTYRSVRAGKSVPYGGQKFDPTAEGTIWPSKRGQRPKIDIPSAV